MPGNMRDAFARLGFDAPAPDPSAEPREHTGLEQLGPDLIVPGLVVLDLDPVMLLEQPGVICTANPATRSGPFVCVGVAGEHSTWAGLTSKWRLERLEIPPEWRTGGRERWQTRRQFLTDGGTLYKGPSAAFAAASWRETFSDPEELPRLTPIGLEAVQKRVEAARGRLKKARRRERRRRESFQAAQSKPDPKDER